MNARYYDVGTLAETIDSDCQLYSSDYVEQRIATAMPISLSDTLAYVLIRAETVPQSFFDSLADFGAGRVVDIDIALNDPPPGV